MCCHVFIIRIDQDIKAQFEIKTKAYLFVNWMFYSSKT